MTSTAAIARLEKQAARLGLRIVRANGPETDLFVISRDNDHGDKLAVVSLLAASAYLDGYGHGQHAVQLFVPSGDDRIVDTNAARYYITERRAVEHLNEKLERAAVIVEGNRGRDAGPAMSAISIRALKENV